MREPVSEQQIQDFKTTLINAINTTRKDKQVLSDSTFNQIRHIEKMVNEGKITESHREEIVGLLASFYFDHRNTHRSTFKTWINEAVKYDYTMSLYVLAMYHNENKYDYPKNPDLAAQYLAKVLQSNNDNIKKQTADYLVKHSSLKAKVDNLMPPASPVTPQTDTTSAETLQSISPARGSRDDIIRLLNTCPLLTSDGEIANINATNKTTWSTYGGDHICLIEKSSFSAGIVLGGGGAMPASPTYPIASAADRAAYFNALGLTVSKHVEGRLNDNYQVNPASINFDDLSQRISKLNAERKAKGWPIPDRARPKAPSPEAPPQKSNELSLGEINHTKQNFEAAKALFSSPQQLKKVNNATIVEIILAHRNNINISSLEESLKKGSDLEMSFRSLAKGEVNVAIAFLTSPLIVQHLPIEKIFDILQTHLENINFLNVILDPTNQCWNVTLIAFPELQVISELLKYNNKTSAKEMKTNPAIALNVSKLIHDVLGLPDNLKQKYNLSDAQAKCIHELVVATTHKMQPLLPQVTVGAAKAPTPRESTPTYSPAAPAPTSAPTTARVAPPPSEPLPPHQAHGRGNR